MTIVIHPASAAQPLVRAATAADMAIVQAIYARHVREGLASFEIEPPDTAEIAARWRAVVERGLPYRIIEADGAVRGFAYAAPYRARAGYRYTVEDSVYIAMESLGRGYGRRLLADVIEASTRAGMRQMVAVIGDSANVASIALHGALGFRNAGTLVSAGYKMGRWIDSVLMQRALGDGDATLPRD